jgi:SAM-dependent methyltransferase
LAGEPGEAFDRWLGALETRHFAALTFPEVRRALQALSSLYVERRERLGRGAALEGAGKRAAFALFYGPLHFVLVREIVRALGAAEPPPRRILDLGCGTGAAGAAWALAAGAAVEGVDRSGWAVDEARWTLSTLGVHGAARQGDLVAAAVGGRDDALLAAFSVNELDEPARGSLLGRLLAAAQRGARVLVVEPLARRSLGWWAEWNNAFAARGGRADQWRFEVERPALVAKLDRAAGLDHRRLTGRSLWLPGAAG